MTTATHETPPAATPRGPGESLEQARLDLHLGIDEVAAKLHLAQRQIQSLEQNDYSSLPGSTYVRGYLKSYALLLGLDPAPILDAHSRLMARPAPTDFSNIAPQKQITSHHHQIRFTTYLVVAIVLGLAIAWWVGRDVRPPNPLLTAQQEVSAPAPVSGPEATAANELAPKPESPAVAPAPQTGLPVIGKPASPVAASFAKTPLPAGPRGRLVVHADEDAWVDVRDARQVKLLYETVPAGRELTLEGVPPLNIFLGNAAGTRLEYNGEAVDVASHKRGMVARFTVGEE
jgi:cytoskeleton protein RodZ